MLLHSICKFSSLFAWADTSPCTNTRFPFVHWLPNARHRTQPSPQHYCCRRQQQRTRPLSSRLTSQHSSTKNNSSRQGRPSSCLSVVVDVHHYYQHYCCSPCVWLLVGFGLGSFPFPLYETDGGMQYPASRVKSQKVRFSCFLFLTQAQENKKKRRTGFLRFAFTRRMGMIWALYCLVQSIPVLPYCSVSGRCVRRYCCTGTYKGVCTGPRASQGGPGALALLGLEIYFSAVQYVLLYGILCDE